MRRKTLKQTASTQAVRVLTSWHHKWCKNAKSEAVRDPNKPQQNKTSNLPCLARGLNRTEQNRTETFCKLPMHKKQKSPEWNQMCQWHRKHSKCDAMYCEPEAHAYPDPSQWKTSGTPQPAANLLHAEDHLAPLTVPGPLLVAPHSVLPALPAI